MLTGTRAVAVRDGSVDLAAKGATGAARWTVPCGLVVWTGGTEARPLTAQLLRDLADATAAPNGAPGKAISVATTNAALGVSAPV